jgi:hypothetical protein
MVAALVVGAIGRTAAAQPADCATEVGTVGVIPLLVDLARRPGVPRGVTRGVAGLAYVEVPAGPGIACRDARPPPQDVLRGEPGVPSSAEASGEGPQQTARPTDGTPRAEADGEAPRASDDLLRGQAGDALRGPPARDLLRSGVGTPHVRVEQLTKPP